MDLAGTDAIILAAGRGSRLGEMGETLPKGFIEVNGTTLVERSIAQLQAVRISRITIVTGHCGEHFRERFDDSPHIRLLENSRFQETGSFESLRIGMNGSAPTSLVLDSDIIFEPKALMAVMSCAAETVVLASGLTRSGDEVWVTAQDNILVNLGKHRPQDDRNLIGEFVGISRIGPSLKNHLHTLWSSSREDWSRREYEQAFNVAARQIPLHVSLVSKLLWGEVDTLEQLSRVKNLFSERDGEDHD